MNRCHYIEDNRSDRATLQERGACCRNATRRDPSRGFSLVELLIAMAVGMIVLGAMYGLFTIQSKQLGNQDVIAEMQQNARMAMDMVTREVRMAGYNPSGTLTSCTGTTTTTATCVGIKNAAATTISFTADLNGNGSLVADPSINPSENIVFNRYQSGTSTTGVFSLGRTSNGSLQPAIEYLDLLSFTYLAADGTATTNLANIREIQITIRTIASKMDPAYTVNGGYRTYTLTAKVAPRNLVPTF